MENTPKVKGELSDLINKIQEITDTDKYSMKFFPGATIEEIFQFEQNNNFTFPELVKEWLEFTDGCRLFNTTVQLYGVAHKPYINIDQEGIIGNYIEIGTFNFGDPICVLDNSQKIFQHGDSIIEYKDFKEFLELVIEIGARN